MLVISFRGVFEKPHKAAGGTSMVNRSLESTFGLKGMHSLKYLFLVKFSNILFLKLVERVDCMHKCFSLCRSSIPFGLGFFFPFINISDCPPPSSEMTDFFSLIKLLCHLSWPADYPSLQSHMKFCYSLQIE